MTPEQVVAFFGGSEKGWASKYGNGSIGAAAEKLNVSRQAIYLWLWNGKVPLVHQYRIERYTNGVLKAEDPHHIADRRSRSRNAA